MMAMGYGHVYVARVAFGAKDTQTVQAFLEAEAYPGPSLIIAYSHCIAHGYDMAYGAEQQKLAVESGVWPLYRFDPRRVAAGRAAPQARLRRRRRSRPKDYMRNETRFRMVEKLDPERFKRLLEQAEHAGPALRASTSSSRASTVADETPKPKPAPSRARERAMDLSTTLPRLEPSAPLRCPGPRRWCDDLDTVRRLEDAGAAAIVMHSLFEEQITAGADRLLPAHRGARATPSPRPSATSPRPTVFALGPEEYLEHIAPGQERRRGPRHRVPQRHHRRAAGSTTPRLMEQAGADALELNVYTLATDPD